MSFPCLPLLLLLGATPVPVEGLVLPFRQAEICAAVSGRLLDLKAAEGQAVTEGQVLAVLDGRLEELEMQRAKVLVERREFEAKGAKKLYDSKIIPEAKALESRIELDLARLHYETAAQQVKLRTVVSPMAGVVALRTHEAGETVASGQPLFRILDLSKVVVQCAVTPEVLGTLHPGQKVRVRLPAAAGDCEGEVLLVAACADAEGKVGVRVVVENPERRIRPGLKAQVLLP